MKEREEEQCNLAMDCERQGKVGGEQWEEYLRSGYGGRGGGYDRDRVVEAGGGLTRWDLRAGVRDMCSRNTMG